jgi:probable F420-dependent oxidoreductase
VSLGFGLLSAQLRPGETSWARAYEDTVEVARAAEAFGYDSVWTTEHHFVDDGYMPSLAVVSAALAAATNRIDIGTGVLLAPLHDPLRLAEDAATVQLLSENRFILGLGLGWADYEFEAFGADLRRRGRTMDEILDILPRAWSGEVFAHEGTEYRFPPLAVRPVPDEPVPIVVGGAAEPAIRRAARKADGIFSNAQGAAFVEQVRWARDELASCGRDEADFRWYYYAILHPADDPDQGWEELLPHLWQMSWKYSDMKASSTRSGPPPAAPPPSAASEAMLRSRAVFAGPGEYLVEELREIERAAGVPVEFVARSYHPTMERSRQLEVMARLAEDVLPHL